MTGNIVSRRYASALFNLGKESGTVELERYGTSLGAIGEAIEKTPKLAEVFKNPVLSPEEKKKIALSLLDIVIAGETEKRFCALLADKGRLPLLPAIAMDYNSLLDEYNGVKRGSVTTAMELDDARKETIKTKLESQTEHTLKLEFYVDPSIIGGIVLRIGDIVYDASLKAQLDNLKESIKRGE